MNSTSAAAPDSVWLVISIIGGFIIVFPAFWCFVVWLLSQVGGWSRLALRFSASQRLRQPAGTHHSGLTGMVGVVSYRNVLTLHVDRDGFFLEVMALFRIGHPRLFIPWSEITGRKPRQVLWWKAETLSIGSPVIATITLPAGLIPPDHQGFSNHSAINAWSAGPGRSSPVRDCS